MPVKCKCTVTTNKRNIPYGPSVIIGKLSTPGWCDTARLKAEEPRLYMSLCVQAEARRDVSAIDQKLSLTCI